MNRTNSIFNMFDDISESLINKTLDEFDEIKKNVIKDYVGEGIQNEVTFKYDTKLEPEDKKKIIIDKLNRWTKIKRVFGSDTVIKFVFAEDEIFYFTWNDELKSFVTEDPNGDRFMYNAKDETLDKLVDDVPNNVVLEKDLAPKNEASGVNSKVVDDTVDISDGEGIEKNFNLKDDKNLASNLRNALRESYAEWKNDDKCKEIFCPVAASENFKKNVRLEQADSLLRSDLRTFCGMFRKYGKDSLLLAVLAYNVGPYKVLGDRRKFRKSRLLQKIERGKRDIEREYLDFCRWKGKVIASIRRRRNTELMLLYEP